MSVLVALASGVLIALSFYLGVKIVNRYLKGLENSQWKNFVTVIVGFIILMIILTIPILFIGL
jgi:hypothetical protein